MGLFGQQGEREQPEQQQQPQTIFTQPPLPDNPSEDFFRYRIDSTDILDEITHQLKGEILVQDKDGKAKYIKKFKKLVNEEGINKICYLIYSCGLNKNIYLGNLSHEEISYKMKNIKIKLSVLIFKKYKAYEIEPEMRSLVVETIKNQIHSGLSRCEDGKEADQLSTATQMMIHKNQTEQTKQQGGGIMQFLNPFSRKT